MALNTNAHVTVGTLNSALTQFKEKEDTLLAAKANQATTYTKSEVDGAVGVKANSSDVYTKAETYTKSEVDGAVGVKANSTDVYTKSEVDTVVNAKANAADTYTKTEVYTKSEVDTAVSTAVSTSKHLKKEIATAEQITAFEADPTTADANTIYLLKDEDAEGEDVYKEYTVAGEGETSQFVCIGSTTTDLSDYVKTEDIVYATASDVTEIINGIFGE